MANTVTNPQVTDDYSPLEVLAIRALRRYGDTSPGTVDGDVISMFIDLANEIVTEVNAHPYRENMPKIDFYTHYTDKRPIHDAIIVNGLLFYYSIQQMSSKAKVYEATYYRTMNAMFNTDANGNGRPELKLLDKDFDGYQNTNSITYHQR
jgi:hypothetical protein